MVARYQIKNLKSIIRPLPFLLKTAFPQVVSTHSSPQEHVIQEHPFVSGDATSKEPLVRLGLDPARPFYDLNLAGAQGTPSPQMLVRANNTPPALLLPDFGTQDYEVPFLQPYDLTSPGITCLPEFAADPALPALGEYAHPYDLDISQSMNVDPQLERDIPTPADIAASLYPGLGFPTLEVLHAISDVDPSLPVTLIRGGTSKNCYTYSEEALQAIAGMVEGAHAYADHGDANVLTRRVRDIVGFYHDANYIPPDSSNARGDLTPRCTSLRRPSGSGRLFKRRVSWYSWSRV